MLGILENTVKLSEPPSGLLETPSPVHHRPPFE